MDEPATDELVVDRPAIAALNDVDFLAMRRKVRHDLEQLPPLPESERLKLAQLFQAFNDEFETRSCAFQSPTWRGGAH